MGFYPKHLKVRRQRWIRRVIATAALSGCVFQRWQMGRGGRPMWTLDGIPLYPNKSGLALSFLMAKFNKEGLLPWR